MTLSASVVLAPGYSWLAASLLTEPWRNANRVTGKAVIDWRLTSWSGEGVVASNGMVLPLSGPARFAFARPDLVVVIAGDDPAAAAEPELCAWLRCLNRRGVMIGGVDTGPEILAMAGLLADHPTAIHHEAIPQFRERHLGLGLSYGLYAIEGRRATCAGGVSTLDFSLALIARFLGESLAQRTAAALIYARRPADTEGLLANAGEGWIDPRLARAVRSLSAPAGAAGAQVQAAARAAGVSERQLSRLFHRAFGASPRDYLCRLRLQRARTLLEETNLAVGAVALAVGFAGGAEFSRAWRRRHGQSPRDFREARALARRRNAG